CIRRSSVNSALNEKVLNTKNIIVYPNPAKDIITLNGLENIEYEATILDIMGRNILTQSVTNSSNQIKLNGIVSGYYLLSIKHKNEIITKKVIVTN
ncbi:MAG: T9SS type A sorting domain-containing protein, partial [Bacteroidia bacterium]|nr:T9SS type A sorting domain-containing protein [Bacteroidia bacterium]